MRPVIAHRVGAVAAVVTVSLVALTGCSSSKPTPSAAVVSTTPGAGATPSTALVASDQFGQRAKIDVPAGQPDGKLDVKVKIQGNGTKVATGDMVVFNFTGKLWRTGQDLGSSYDKDPQTGVPAPVTTIIGQHQVLPGWEQGLVGQAAGSRVELDIPPALGLGTKGAPASNGVPAILPTDTLIFDLDIVGVYPTLTPDVLAGPNLPIDSSLPQVAPFVAQDPKNVKDPKVTIPSSKPAPTQLVAKTVIQGKGPQVKSGQTIVIQYTGYLWKDGSVFDSSWSHGKAPFVTTIGVGAVVKGWDQGLVGQSVGSRVLLVIPPADGYGPSGNGTISGTDTMVFVVDILDAG